LWYILLDMHRIGERRSEIVDFSHPPAHRLRRLAVKKVMDFEIAEYRIDIGQRAIDLRCLMVEQEHLTPAAGEGNRPRPPDQPRPDDRHFAHRACQFAPYLLGIELLNYWPSHEFRGDRWRRRVLMDREP